MIIYKTTNLINNKIYIGQDFKNNPNYLGSGKYLKNALNKYGKENFIKEILCECNSKEELNEKEIYFIKLFDSLNPKIGYNISEGGHGGILGEFHRKKIIESNKKRIISNETRKKMGEKVKQRLLNKKNHPMFGKHFSEETKKKMSESQRKRFEINFVSEETKKKMSESQRKRFKQIEEIKKAKERMIKRNLVGEKNSMSKKIEINNIIYYSIKEACDILNINRKIAKKIGNIINEI